jgi:hypothetical protein
MKRCMFRSVRIADKVFAGAACEEQAFTAWVRAIHCRGLSRVCAGVNPRARWRAVLMSDFWVGRSAESHLFAGKITTAKWSLQL